MDSNQKEPSKLEVLRHSAAHLLAHAITELYPDVKLTIGPATSEGFFYDMQSSRNFKEEDLPEIEKRMKEIANKDYAIEHKKISKEKARQIYKDNKFKLELINNIEEDTVGLSTQGNFFDLCRGNHVSSTGQIKHIKLTGISGSYWRADKESDKLQRIHGTAFFSKKDLKEYEQIKEEALKYDHRRLGKELDLFSFHPEGPGFPFFHPKGQVVINKLIEYMSFLHRNHSYKEITTPTLLNEELWHRSGHYEHYKENMYFSSIDEKGFAIKPMNCPGTFLLYKNRPRSYRELPLRLAEFGHVHRHELSGVLHGLLRVRAFTQDDAHIFVTQEQLSQEVENIINLTFKVLKRFDFKDIEVAVSTRPEDSMGSQEAWDKATKALTNALNSLNIPYTIKEGEGAFYGPKIEFVIKDSMKRQWQCGTIQIDFFQPENFDLSYVAPSGKLERPIVIHQAIYGSFERFFAILLEHYKGNLPFWLSPVQVKILTITDAQKEYAEKVYDKLFNNGIRVEIDKTSDPLSAQIKTAQLEKASWMIIIGKREAENNTVTIRYLDGTQDKAIPLDELIKRAKEKNKL